MLVSPAMWELEVRGRKSDTYPHFSEDLVLWVPVSPVSSLLSALVISTYLMGRKPISVVFRIQLC